MQSEYWIETPRMIKMHDNFSGPRSKAEDNFIPTATCFYYLHNFVGTCRNILEQYA